jgi:hypothetical protein
MVGGAKPQPPEMHKSYYLHHGARETGLGQWRPGFLRSNESAKRKFPLLTMPRENN